MALDSFLAPWSGQACRHIPYGAQYDVLDLQLAGRSSENRWNAAGEPTLYLAADRAVALGELARHLQMERPRWPGRPVIVRQVYSMQVQIDAAFDLHDARAWAELSLTNAPHCFLDVGIARATAQFLRRTTPAQGILVPSMAFLDQPDRWVLVLFLEKLPPDPGRFLRSVESVGVFHVDV